jgi:uncharacterized repeat protein (TIGR04076 family)
MLKVTVSKVMHVCTAEPPMKPGDYFTVDDGCIEIPEGGQVCMWALHSLLPTLVDMERARESQDESQWQAEYIQCPDPEGRVIFKIDTGVETELEGWVESVDVSEDSAERALQDLRVVVQEVGHKCSSGMQPGDYFIMQRGRLYIPAQRRFCLYALQAVLLLLPAKQRTLLDGDWLKDAAHVVCPDPAGNVVMRIEPYL